MRLALVPLVVVSLLAACGGAGGEDTWPQVTIEDLAGQPVHTASLVGDVPTVVSVWGVLCKPCREELPGLQGLLDEHKGQFRVVGVNNGDDPATAAAFLAELGVEFPSYRDPEARLTSELGIVALPGTVVVLPDGEIAWKRLGTVTMAEVQRQLAPHLSPVDSPGDRPIDG